MKTYEKNNRIEVLKNWVLNQIFLSWNFDYWFKKKYQWFKV